MGLENVFEQFPLLETERFSLRELKTEDAPHLFGYFSQDIVTKYYNLENFTEEQQAFDLINKFSQGFIEKRQIRWGAELKDTGKVVGTCGFHAIDIKHFKAEIGYELHPDYWGKGMMPEITKAILRFGFGTMGLNRIEALYHPNNEQSWNVLKKSGFEYEGTLRKRWLDKGKFVDAAIASIIKIP
ncbi:GNAT family N-acetyltransferase [Mesobacillus jeotgali]|uniref:GNAT family N-acetyltransferase n=1 Tax=Mesobacillus jeotgali TaxID=129985 RepID=UPI0009A7B7FA|nr:GNAT family protein [Mesobacillus jeotgali]